MDAPAADYATLVSRVEYLEHELANLKMRLSAKDPLEALAHVVGWNDRVLELTRALFLEPIKLTPEADPENSDPYFVVEAAASGSPKELSALFMKWHEAMWNGLHMSANYYRLSIFPVSLD